MLPREYTPMSQQCKAGWTDAPCLCAKCAAFRRTLVSTINEVIRDTMAKDIVHRDIARKTGMSKTFSCACGDSTVRDYVHGNDLCRFMPLTAALAKIQTARETWLAEFDRLLADVESAVLGAWRNPVADAISIVLAARISLKAHARKRIE